MGAPATVPWKLARAAASPNAPAAAGVSLTHPNEQRNDSRDERHTIHHRKNSIELKGSAPATTKMLHEPQMVINDSIALKGNARGHWARIRDN